LIGPFAEENVRKFHVDKVFLGVDGFDPSIGLYTPNMEEAYLNQLMITKGNDGIEPLVKKQLEDAGIEVLIA
jgi:DeoR family transcriptional regulator of aga operon